MASPGKRVLFSGLAVEDIQLSDDESIFHLVQTHDVDWVQFRASFEIPDDCGKLHHKMHLMS
jgi:hypothetical protein